MVTQYEPKKTNRWILRFPAEYNIPEWIIYETSRPTIRVKTNIFGFKKFSYDIINISMRDTVVNSVTKSVYELFNKLKDTDQLDALYYELEMLDPTGVVVEQWLISGCSIVSIDYGYLSMDDDSIATVTLRVKPIRAKLIK